MDNIITSPVTPPITLQPGDKVMSGQIVEVPPALAQFKTGDNLLLKIMFDSQAFKMNTDLSVKLIIANKEVPLNIKFDVPLNLEPDEPHQILAKITGATSDSLRFNLVTINNKKPEAFILQPNVTNSNQPETVIMRPNSGQSGALRREETSAKTSAPVAPLVKELNTASGQLKFIPLKAAPLLDKLMTEFKIPEPLRRQVGDAVQNLELPVRFKAVLPTGGTQEPRAENILTPLRQTLQHLAVAQQNPQQIPVIINKLVTQLQELPLQILPAVAEIKGEGNITVLSTPLGDVISESPLKIQPQTPILLQISEIRTAVPLAAPLPLPEKVQESMSPLSNLLNKFIDLLQPQNLMPQIEKLNFMQLLRSENSDVPILQTSTGQRPSNQNLDGFLPLFDILKPMDKSPSQNHIASQLLDKIPTLNNKMLSNLYSFVKAAVSHNAEAWLGRELSSELKALGAEGAETLSRAAQYVNSHHREGLSWRIVEIPFLAGAELSKIRLSIKKPQDEEEKQNPLSKRKTGTRFLLETDFSKLGQFQFDGFSLAKDRRLDLVIRTSRALPQGFCADMVKLFKNSLHDVNYTGNININLKENFIKIMEDEINQNQIKDGVYI